MPNWLFEILFFGFMAVAIEWPIFWRAVIFTAAGNVYEAITRKPEPLPTPVETPEESKTHVDKILAEIVEMNRIRAENGLPPHVTRPEFQVAPDAHCRSRPDASN